MLVVCDYRCSNCDGDGGLEVNGGGDGGGVSCERCVGSGGCRAGRQ